MLLEVVMWAMIGTWRMALEAITNASNKLNNNEINAGDAVEMAISEIEDFPYFKSVGYGGLPNEEMVVELDAGYMDGDSFDIGAIMAIKDYKNPIKIARALSHEKVNCVLSAEGAEKYAHKHGFVRQNMLSDRAIIHYQKRINSLKEAELKPYIGHDTVGICALDQNHKICVGTSTSGLFMKKSGRIGDSPIVGSGFYADSEYGACSATGLGEDLMKGCISYEVVSLMKQGMAVQQACEKAVNDLNKRLIDKRLKAGDLSIVALDKDGNMGVATNIDGFSFVYASEKQEPIVYLVKNENGKMIITQATQAWLDDYMKTRTAELKL